MSNVIDMREHMLRRIEWKSMSQDEWHKIIEEAKTPTSELFNAHSFFQFPRQVTNEILIRRCYRIPT